MGFRDVAFVHQDNEYGTQAASGRSNILELAPAFCKRPVDATPATIPSLGPVEPSLHRAPQIQVQALAFPS